MGSSWLNPAAGIFEWGMKLCAGLAIRNYRAKHDTVAMPGRASA
jgi:hypothetical protein